MTEKQQGSAVPRLMSENWRVERGWRGEMRGAQGK